MTDEATPQDESEGMANLRASRDREKARADALEAQIKDMVYTQAGVDKDSWVGQQLMQTYDGDLTPDAIRQFATEKGIPLSQGGEVPPAQVQQQLNEQIAQQAAGAQQQGQVVAGSQQRDLGTDLMTQAEAKLADGDLNESILLKTMHQYG